MFAQMVLNIGGLAGLAFMAFGTGWHAALFAFIGYLLTGISNKISYSSETLARKIEARD